MDPLEQSSETLMQEGKPQEALQLIETALGQGETAELWNHWATIQFTCGDFTKAEAGYKRALELNDCAREAAVNFGFMLFAQGRLQEAMPLLERHKATLTGQEKKAISALAAHFQENQEQVVLLSGFATPMNKSEPVVDHNPHPAADRSSGSAPAKIEGFAVVLVSPPEYIHIQALEEIAQTVHYGLLALGHNSVITTRLDEPGRRSIVLGAHLLNRFRPGSVKPGSIIYNLKRIDPVSTWIDRDYLALLAQYTVWDYSELNVSRLEECGVHQVTHIPIGWMPQMTRIAPAAQDIDILFYGSMNERRTRILDDLRSRGLRVERAFGIYGARRDALIARSKLVLNIHFHVSKMFDFVRISYLLANGACIVSEDGLDPMEHQFANALKFAPYDALVDTCLQLLSDPEVRTQLAVRGKEQMQSRPEDAYLQKTLGFNKPIQQPIQQQLRSTTMNLQTNAALKPGNHMDDSNLGKWDGWYANLGPADMGAFRYSDTETYQMAADFLSGLHTVEDWGCGAGGFKRFCKSLYIGLDGSKTPFADKIVDFCHYRSSVDGVMMRHVLEHNYEWEKVLTNAVASAKRKMCLVLFTPFQTDGTKEIAHNKQHGVDVPDLAFRREDIEGLLVGCDFTSRSLSTPTGYGVEHIYFITKREAICVISANLGNMDSCNMSRHVKQDLPAGWSVDHFNYDSTNTKLRDKALHPRMQAKIYKMYGWQLHPGYDHYIWLDAAFVISSNHTARWMVESCGQSDMAAFRHSTRSSIKSEVEYCLGLIGSGNKYLASRYGSEPLEEQVNHYYNELDFRDSIRFDDSLLIEAGAFCYRPTRAMKQMLQDWYLECCRWSCQDQISLPVVLQRHGVTPALFAANMYSNPHLSYVWRGWDG